MKPTLQPFGERLFTSQEAADLYGVPQTTFLVWWMRGEIPFRRVLTPAGHRFVLDDPERRTAAARTAGPEAQALPDPAPHHGRPARPRH